MRLRSRRSSFRSNTWTSRRGPLDQLLCERVGEHALEADERRAILKRAELDRERPAIRRYERAEGAVAAPREWGRRNRGRDEA